MKKLVSLVIALVAALGAHASSIYMNNFSMEVDETKTVEVRFDNTTSSNMMAIQFDVYIDNDTSSFKFASAPIKAGISNSSDVVFNTGQPHGSNMYRVIISSWDTPITGSGVIASFKVKCTGITSASMAMNMSIRNVTIVDVSGNTTNLSNTSTVATVTSPVPDIMLKASDMSFTDGQTKKVQFSLNTALNLTSLQIDLSGINLTPNFSTVTLLGTVANTHYKQVAPSLGRIVIASNSNSVLPKGTPIFEIDVAANNFVEKYGCCLNLTNCITATPNITTYYLPDHCIVPTKNGFDVNSDGEVDVRDITSLIDAIMNSK